MLIHAHWKVCKSFDGKTQDMFETTGNSKICSHVVRLDRSVSLFSLSLKANVLADLLLGGLHLQFSFLNTYFIFYKILLPQRPEHAEHNIVNSHINGGIKCEKYLIICNYYNFITFKVFIYFSIYKCIIFSAQFCPLYILHRIFPAGLPNRRFQCTL